MAYQSLGLGTTAGDGTGDSIRDGGDKINDNFVEIYTALGTGSALSSGISATSSTILLANAVNTGATQFADGSVSAPSITNTGDVNTGMYWSAADTISFTTGGTKRLDIDSSGIDVTGAITATTTITGTTLEATGDTSAGDNAAMGYTAAEGLILTGQGSTGDVTLKNDADATVCTVPTGQSVVRFIDSAKATFGASDDLAIYHDGSNSYIDDAGTGTIYMRTDSTMRLKKYSADEDLATFAADGAVTLYYDNSAKITTASGGISVTGTYTGTGLMTTGGNIVIPNAGNIGSASDTDAMAIASNGIVTFSQIPVLPANTISETMMQDDAISSNELKTLSTLLIKNSGGSTLATFHTAGA